MPDLQQIVECARQAAQLYPIKRIDLFGSYAEGRQTEASDVDVLVEFLMPSVSLVSPSTIIPPGRCARRSAG
ncbi:MAG: nucleotidyltransferase domain-containing protein [Syntrophomonadaceae bacterium]|nr:nucleotidyltransferase domain-containing protein [Syntrophomonadaceae bacterium]